MQSIRASQSLANLASGAPLAGIIVVDGAMSNQPSIDSLDPACLRSDRFTRAGLDCSQVPAVDLRLGGFVETCDSLNTGLIRYNSAPTCVIVTDTLSLTGQCKGRTRSALALAERGLQVTVFAAAGQPSDELAACCNVRVISTGQGESLASRNRLRGALRGLWNRTASVKMNALLATLDRSRRSFMYIPGRKRSRRVSSLVFFGRSFRSC